MLFRVLYAEACVLVENLFETENVTALKIRYKKFLLYYRT
jgi:hypothetical protein